jgi:ureidoglycolate hydrolase
MNDLVRLKKIKAEWITKEKFQPYGQLITPTANNKPFDDNDAQLNLSQGIPRLYIMHLTHRGRKFNTINRHVLCTQCLGSLEGKDWFIAVAPPSPKNEPDLNQLAAFRIPGNSFIKLDTGTWHAGPYFDFDYVDFYNLELSDTNFNDFYTYDFIANNQIEFEIIKITD